MGVLAPLVSAQPWPPGERMLLRLWMDTMKLSSQREEKGVWPSPVVITNELQSSNQELLQKLACAHNCYRRIKLIMRLKCTETHRQ